MAPSSSGLGFKILNLATGVRISLGSPFMVFIQNLVGKAERRLTTGSLDRQATKKKIFQKFDFSKNF